MKRDKGSTSLLPKIPCDVMIRCLYQSQHSMEDMKMGKKQAKSRHYTEKQKLTPNNLHLCIRNKGERIKGKEWERSQEIKTRREKKEKETSLTSQRWSMHFSSKDQRKRQNTYQHIGKGRDVLGGLTNAKPMQQISAQQVLHKAQLQSPRSSRGLTAPSSRKGKIGRIRCTALNPGAI